MTLRYTVQRSTRLRAVWLIYGPMGWPMCFAHGLRCFSRKADAEAVAFWLNQD